jgi:GntR family transcriptional regulator
MKTIDRESPVPVYYQIALNLRERIHRQEWRTGDQIPPEPELAVLYGVSRVTVRQALAELVKDGLLTRQRGSGTFVNQKAMPLTHDFSMPTTFAGRLKRMGFQVSSTILQAETFHEPLPQVMDHLLLGLNTPVAYLKRMHLINGQPTAINRSWFSEVQCPGIAEQDLVENSLSRTLAERYHLVPTRANNWLEVIRATEKDAELLKTFVDTPLILLTTVSYLKDGRPLEYSMTAWLGDRIRFNFNMDFGASPDTSAIQMSLREGQSSGR